MSRHGSPQLAEGLEAQEREPRWTVTLSEAANLLGISERHLRNLIRDGTVRVIELGARRVIAMSEMRRLIGDDQ